MHRRSRSLSSPFYVMTRDHPAEHISGETTLHILCHAVDIREDIVQSKSVYEQTSSSRISMLGPEVVISYSLVDFTAFLVLFSILNTISVDLGNHVEIFRACPRALSLCRAMYANLASPKHSRPSLTARFHFPSQSTSFWSIRSRCCGIRTLASTPRAARARTSPSQTLRHASHIECNRPVATLLVSGNLLRHSFTLPAQILAISPYEVYGTSL